MWQLKFGRSALILSAGFLLCSPAVFALEIEPGVGAGLLYTDNAELTADNEDDDLVMVGYAGVRIDENNGPFRLNAEAELIHLNYTSGSFGNQTYPALRTTALWQQVPGRLDWQASNYFTQRETDSLEGRTPDNIQNTNVFTFGPDITFPHWGRHTLTLNPRYRNFYYEDEGTDNQQYELPASWFYRMYPTFGVGLSGSVTQVDYDGGDNRATDYTRRVLQAGLSGTTARSEYSLNLGGTDISRDGSGSTSGASGNLDWLYRMSGFSTARLYISSDISDTGNLLLDSEIDPDTGDFSNVQTSDDVVRNNIVRLTYRRDDAALTTAIWGEYRDLDYEGQESDRDVREVGADLDYRATALLTTGIYGRYALTDEADANGDDTRYTITGTVSYQLGRKLRTTFDLRYENQDSDGGSADEYSEFSTFVRLVYGFARVERPGRGRR
jgi:hypothetical protein